MKRNRTILAVALLLSLSGAPQAFGQTVLQTAVGPVNAGTNVIAPLSNQDMHFMLDAAGGNSAELQEAQMAVQRATTADIRTYAQQMIVDHGAAGTQLASLAARKGLALPVGTDEHHRGHVFRLGNMSGRAFDDAYINGQISDHKHMIGIFEREARSGRDGDVRAFAAAQLPTLRMHLTMAQQLKDARRHASTGTTTVIATPSDTTVVAPGVVAPAHTVIVTPVVPNRTTEEGTATGTNNGSNDGLSPNSGANMPTTPPDVNNR